MASPDRFIRLSKLSLDRYDIAIDLDWRYPHLFDFLQISPSYRLAHLIATGRLERNARPLPADFAEVETAYRAFGSVYRTYFGEWWLNVAQYLFGIARPPEPKPLLRLSSREAANQDTLSHVMEAMDRYLTAERPAQGETAALLLAIPIHRDRRRLLREIESAIEAAFPGEEQQAGIITAKLVHNKMRERTFLMAMRTLLARASVPKAKLYQVGNHTKIAPQYWTDTKLKRRDDPEVFDRRRMMDIVVARQLHRAYLLAENAARMKFPSLDPLAPDPHRPEFDYPELGRQLRSYVQWGAKRVAEIKASRAQARMKKNQPSSPG